MSSMIYALVHFMESARQVEPVVWYSGLELLPRMLRGFVHWQQLVPGFLNLTLVGALLALAFYRTGNLYFSIGLHAGWIFWLKSYGVLTKEVKDANVWIWGGSKMIDGWLAVFILVLTVPAVFYLSAPSRAHSSVNSAGVTA
jgi:membrane protease YdiL (CAAX protease family)